MLRITCHIYSYVSYYREKKGVFPNLGCSIWTETQINLLRIFSEKKCGRLENTISHFATTMNRIAETKHHTPVTFAFIPGQNFQMTV